MFSLAVHLLAVARAGTQRMMCGTLSHHLSWKPHASSPTATLSQFRPNQTLRKLKCPDNQSVEHFRLTAETCFPFSLLQCGFLLICLVTRVVHLLGCLSVPSVSVHISEGILNIFHETSVTFQRAQLPLVKPLCCILVIFGNNCTITLIFPTVL